MAVVENGTKLAYVDHMLGDPVYGALLKQQLDAGIDSASSPPPSLPTFLP